MATVKAGLDTLLARLGGRSIADLGRQMEEARFEPQGPEFDDDEEDDQKRKKRSTDDGDGADDDEVPEPVRP